jgi:hypothetical protein
MAEQKTLTGADPADTYYGKKPAEVELVTRSPERQFMAPPGARPPVAPEEEDNPHPSRSLWHYTDKHPAIKRKKHV